MKAVPWLALSFLLVLTPLAASGQVRYVDENGVAHWVGSAEQIPERYRERAQPLRLPEMSSDAGTWVLWQGRIVTDKATQRVDWQDWKPTGSFDSRKACLEAEAAAQGVAVSKGGRFYKGEDRYRCLQEGTRP
jgi:hypothetical protein